MRSVQAVKGCSARGAFGVCSECTMAGVQCLYDGARDTGYMLMRHTEHAPWLEPVKQKDLLAGDAVLRRQAVHWWDMQCPCGRVR